MNQARSRSLDRLRFEHRKKRVDAQPDETADTTTAATHGDAMDATDLRRALEDALTTLTADERAAIETAFFSELTYSETATRLDQRLAR